MLKNACFLVLGLSTLAMTAVAEDYRQGDLSIDKPWSRPTPPGTPVGVGYMTIHNHGDAAVTLVAGESPVAGRVSVHETTADDGLMKMQPLPDGLAVPAGQTVVLKPRSYHLMLEALSEPLKAGDEVPLTLTFEGHEPVDIRLRVEQMDSKPAMDHSSH